MTIPAKLPKDFKLFQIRVFDVCPACDGSGKVALLPKPVQGGCKICKGLKVVATVLHEGATLDILLAKVFDDAGKKKVNELKETCSRCGQPLGSFPCLCPKQEKESGS